MFDFFSPIEQIRRISAQKAVKNIDESYGYLLNDFSSVAGILSRYNPLDVMKLSLWDERKNRGEKIRDAVKREASSLLPVILQSVLSSTHFTSGGVERNVGKRDWERLKSIAEDVMRRLVRLIENRTALALEEEKLSDKDAENYRNIIASYLFVDEVTALSLSRDSAQLRSLLEEKTELKERTGVDYLTLSINLDNIARKGLCGIDDFSARVQAYNDDYDLASAKMKSEIEGKSAEEAYRIITAANGWEGRAENLVRERDGFDMFCLSSLSDLDTGAWDVFTVGAGKLDLISFIKMGYWPSARFPFVLWKGEAYTFVGKHIPRFIALTSSFSRKRASEKDVLAIFYRIGIDTYIYDGNRVDISVLESFYDRNLFMDQKAYSVIKKQRDDERSLQPHYGHRRLIVDPDEREDMKDEGDSLVISSAFMAEAKIDRTKKRALLTALLGDLDLPDEKSEYHVVDEDELDRSDAPFDDVVDDSTTDEFEYDTTDEDEEARKLDERDESVALVEYEKKKPVDILDEEKKYALTDEILKKEKEIEKEEEKYEVDLDDDIFDDTEEEERLDEIGEKEVSDYYEDIEEEPQKEEESVPDTPDDDDDGGQLDFFDLLDEEEEKAFDDELEKEDEEEFISDEEKAEKLEVEGPTLEDEIAETIEEDEDEAEAGDECPVGEESYLPEDEEEEDKGDLPDGSDAETALSEEEEEMETSDDDYQEDVTEPQGEDDSDSSGDAESLSDDASVAEEKNPLEEERSIEETESSCLDASVENDNIEDSAVDEECGGVDEEDSSEGVKEEEKPLDVNSWMNDFLGLNDVDPEEADGPSDEADLNDESFVLPRMNMMEEGRVVDSLPEKEEEKTDDKINESTGDEDSSISVEGSAAVDVEESEIPESEMPSSVEEEDEVEKKVLSMEDLDGADEPIPLMTAVETNDDDDVIQFSGIVSDIYRKLRGSGEVFRTFTREAENETLEELENIIQSCWNRMQSEQKDKLFNVPDYSFSILLSHDSKHDDLRMAELLNNVGGVMYSRGKEKWTAVIVYINSRYNLESAMEKTLTKESFSPSDWKRVTYIGEQMRKR